ncbi:MAG: response regulator [Balneolaceae bacterium]
MSKENKGRILIVEDDVLLSLVEERLLKKLGYGVAGKAVDGEDAIKKAKDLTPDAILMDISLKGDMDGVQAMEVIREFSKVPVIYLSGNSDKYNMERAKKTEYIDYLVKPITAEDLVTPLKNAMNGAYVDERGDMAV